MIKRRVIVISQNCVACGCCAKVCPKQAIYIDRGLCAVIDSTLCIGCGKCSIECPASTIQMEESEYESEKTLV